MWWIIRNVSGDGWFNDSFGCFWLELLPNVGMKRCVGRQWKTPSDLIRSIHRTLKDEHSLPANLDPFLYLCFERARKLQVHPFIKLIRMVLCQPRWRLVGYRLFKPWNSWPDEHYCLMLLDKKTEMRLARVRLANSISYLHSIGATMNHVAVESHIPV